MFGLFCSNFASIIVRVPVSRVTPPTDEWVMDVSVSVVVSAVERWISDVLQLHILPSSVLVESVSVRSGMGGGGVPSKIQRVMETSADVETDRIDPVSSFDTHSANEQ
jgi:hypothetical protein